ncbi:hypothetical protein jhhlp_007203 [Lomentospora prolificans]|uniref:Probable endonuclease LCL3 n=1 Tax=Lomentospora prolificans TaxID=41688 RepID=A0A2N3N1Z7_9PEZI|nr:hypothetical protein jhhlp_007203 [Lomentospora prolificans]
MCYNNPNIRPPSSTGQLLPGPFKPFAMAPWPFGSSPPLPPPKDTRPKSLSLSDYLPEDERLRIAVPTVLSTVGILSLVGIYTRYLRRIPGTAYLKPTAFRKRSLFGRVTSVGDGDGFHFYHTPGGRLAGWGWLRQIPDSKAKLKGQTIPIRIAGIDAPEGAHFGRPAQPYADAALTWLTSYILHRRVRAHIHKRDQYDRVVATVYLRRGGLLSFIFPFLLRRDVGLEMLKRGLATTYEAKSGAEFGGREKMYLAAEAKAKAKKVGMWSQKASEFESPRAYKAKIRDNEAGTGGGST